MYALIEHACKYPYVKELHQWSFPDILTLKARLSMTLYCYSFGVQCIKPDIELQLFNIWECKMNLCHAYLYL